MVFDLAIRFFLIAYLSIVVDCLMCSVLNVIGWEILETAYCACNSSKFCVYAA